MRLFRLAGEGRPEAALPPGGNSFTLLVPAGPRRHRLAPALLPRPRPGAAAVEHDAGAHHRAVRVRHADHAAAVREMNLGRREAGGAEALLDGAKILDLLLRIRPVGAP